MDTVDRLLLALCALSGAFCAIGAVMYLYLYAGPIPLPVSAVVFGGALAWISVSARRLAGEPAHAAIPVIAFLVVVAAILLGVAGSIVVLADWRLLILVLCAIGMPIAAGYLASSEK
ncbi:hypothetical protein GCM10027289_22510 [Tsukamurella serpentis]